jgi:hypothetical protein
MNGLANLMDITGLLARFDDLSNWKQDAQHNRC